MQGVALKPEQPRKLTWLVDMLVRLTGCPPMIRKKLGFALYQSQIGQRRESAKMLHGFTHTVWQVRADIRATYRTVYAPQLGGHNLGKQSAFFMLSIRDNIGNRDPQRELDLIRQRLQLARKLGGNEER
jgi:phage-related protein